MRSVQEIQQISDPYQRAHAACDALTQVTKYEEQMRDVRDFAFNELVHQHRESLRAVAERFGISKSQVANIVG